ncbi:DNA repair protein recN [Granulibacter bethesdensis]|uniref:DNA repair protein RecN n=1 Tax=Granulibacter bethesdensis TaxID=364410 RepID=A0AAC9K687_9PROT|nr:DNA repair protein RecN [Granulibacter bethesdensis]APH53656.1 DNA repair protein recN [Granulibacter bethesdensis]APH61234.1 DNA repair protein recN [Granulibacter bethesdensis]
MLTALSIRDVVLIERLDLTFSTGLTVLTGETGAGKSILLDSLGLALGARAEAGLLRAGAEQASVTACFAPPPSHPVEALLAEHELEIEDELVIRRILGKDGRSRAFVNDQPVSIALLRRMGALLVEVQGQHEQMGLADPAMHGPMLDAFGIDPSLQTAVASRWADWRTVIERLSQARIALEEAERDRDWLTHAANELSSLAPQEGEDIQLAAERTRLQQAERRGEAIAAALAELTPRDRRSAGPAAALRAATRSLQRASTPLQGEDQGADLPTAPALAALERAEEALAEAEMLLSRLINDSDADPRQLEHIEERLFALRAAARKHNVTVLELPGLLETLRQRLSALESGDHAIAALTVEENRARQAYLEAAATLSAARQQAATQLERAINAELPPLKLERARFFTRIETLPERQWGEAGQDSIAFLIAANPGQPPGPLAKVASGGELSRLMLALKVVLASRSTVPTLVFDEVDSGIGGATAAAVGERLAQVARHSQVLVVTHSPQVAARGQAHLRVAKSVTKDRTATTVEVLIGAERREEIARMLSGETITEAARAAADDLLARP